MTLADLLSWTIVLFGVLPVAFALIYAIIRENKQALQLKKIEKLYYETLVEAVPRINEDIHSINWEITGLREDLHEWIEE